MARQKLITAVGARPPVSELGTSGSPYTSGYAMGHAPAWSNFIDTFEYVSDLIWPTSVRQGGTYDQMRTDSQLAALLFGVTMPIRRYKWMIDPNGADPEIVEHVAKDFNLDVLGEEPRPRGRTRNRFSHDHHLKTSLLALVYGHMYFEPVGWIGSALKPPNDGLWHLKKLAERMPSTIQNINVAPDGGLISIKQWSAGAKEIPVDRLVGFVWEGEGGNWVGRSLFRDCYKNWLIKDRLLRVDAINHERSGGVPIPEAPPDATDDEIRELSEMASRFRVGEDAGGALMPGAKWQMVSPGSRTATVMDSVRYHDEAMARRFLMMVAMLAQGGTTLGSYSLGEVFSDFFSLGQEAIANWYRDTMNEHVIEDEVDWNWGEDVEQVPLLMYKSDADEDLSTESLKALLDGGVITADPELEDAIRKKYKLPKRGAGNPGPDPNPPDPVIAPSEPGKPPAAAPAAGQSEGSKATFRHWPKVPAQASPPEAESGEDGAATVAPSGWPRPIWTSGELQEEVTHGE